MSKDEIDWSEAVKVRDFPIVAGPGGITEGGLRPFAGPPRPFGGLMWLGLDEEIRNTVALHPELFVTYKLTYKCKHCGKQWTKISAETIPIPRDYEVNEEEDTDLDAAREEGRAKAEQLARGEETTA